MLRPIDHDIFVPAGDFASQPGAAETLRRPRLRSEVSCGNENVVIDRAQHAASFEKKAYGSVRV